MGIQVSTNFDLASQIPLDSRITVSNQTERNALVTSNKVYAGIIVYVTGENKYYYYDTTNSWVEFGSSQSPQNLVYTTGDQTISGGKEFSGTVLSRFLTTRPASVPKQPTFAFLTGVGGVFTGTRHGIPFTNSLEDQEALSNFINSQSWVVSGRVGFSGPYNLITPNLINTTGFVNIPLDSGNNFVYAFTTFTVDDKFKKIERSGIFALLSGEKFGIGTLNPTEKAHIVGNLKLDGQLQTSLRPTVNGTGVLLSGEAAQADLSSTVRTTGDQTISGKKTFATGIVSPFRIGNSGDLSYGKIQLWETATESYQTISAVDGGFTFSQSGANEMTLDFSNEYITLSHQPGGFYYRFLSGFGGTVPIDSNVVHVTGNETISGIKGFATRPTVNGTGILLSGEAVPPFVDINNIITNFNFTGSYNSKLLTINASQNITGTVPTGLSTGYNVAFVQMGAGQLRITGQNGVTIRQRLNLYNTAGQYAIASLVHRENNEYILYGDLV
jgi:hypothetical protein